MSAPATYTTKEAERILGISRRVLNNAILRGELPGFKVGEFFYISRDAVSRLLSTLAQNEGK